MNAVALHAAYCRRLTREMQKYSTSVVYICNVVIDRITPSVSNGAVALCVEYLTDLVFHYLNYHTQNYSKRYLLSLKSLRHS